ncbi:GNAT family N-acetyltransferase [Spirosoma pomorum]
MTTHTIHSQISPVLTDVLPFDQPGFFFNEGSHLVQQRNVPFHLLTVRQSSSQRVMARCAFFTENNRAASPGAAPFGSIEFTEELPEGVLTDFLDQIFSEAKAAGCHTLMLTHYPHCYAPGQTNRLLTALQASGCLVVETHSTFFLYVSDCPLGQRMIASEFRRLQKCQRARFSFAHWLQPDPVAVVNFLHVTYAQLGYRLSLPPERLTHLLVTFPDQFVVFTLHDDDQLIALAVTVRVRHDILYTFLPASLPAYTAFSPMVMLLDGVYAYCQREQISLLDLGVALDNTRQPKAGLARFKRNLGAQESPKYVFSKRL